MGLTKNDLNAIKKLFDTSFDERVPAIIDERVPKIVQPMLDKLEERLTHKIDELTLDVGQFSLETTNNFHDLEQGLNDKIDGVDLRLNNKIGEVSDKLDETTDMSDANRIEFAKIKRKMGLV